MTEEDYAESRADLEHEFELALGEFEKTGDPAAALDLWARALNRIDDLDIEVERLMDGYRVLAEK